MNLQILNLAYNLLKKLGIAHMTVLKDRLELKYQFENQAIIAYGGSEEELVENFYYLYEELQRPA